MPIYEVTGPDGKQYKVDGPEGATDASIIRSVQQNIAAQEAQSQPPQPTAEEALAAFLDAERFADDQQKTALGRGLTRSGDVMVSGFGSATEGVGKLLGLEGLEQAGADAALGAEASQQRAARSATRRQDVEGIGSGLSYAAETFGESAGPMGLGIAAGAGAGALAGAGFFGLGAIPGAIIGAGAAALSQLPLFYGWNRERQIEASGGDRTQVNEGAALLAAVPQAVMDGIATKVLAGIGPNLFFKSTALKSGGIFTRAAKGAGRGIISEVPTEIGQQVLERAQAGLSLTSDDAIEEYIDAGVGAAVIGGPVGAGGNLRGLPSDPTTEADPTTAPQTGTEVGSQGELFPNTDLGLVPTPEGELDLRGGRGTAPQQETTPTIDPRQTEFDFGDTETQGEFDFGEDESVLDRLKRTAGESDTAMGAAGRAATRDIDTTATQDTQFEEMEAALKKQQANEALEAEAKQTADQEAIQKAKVLEPRPKVERDEVQPSIPGLAPTYGEKSRQGRIDGTNIPDSLDYEGETITPELLDSLNVPQLAAIRKRVMGKDINDPAVRDDLVKFANTTATQKSKSAISKYLAGTPKEQGDLFAPKAEATEFKKDIQEDQDFRDLVKEEEATKAQGDVDAATELQEEQDIRDKSTRETIDLAQETKRLRESTGKRGPILADVIEGTPTKRINTLTKAFSAALAKEGITNTEPTEEESTTMQRAIDFQAAKKVEPAEDVMKAAEEAMDEAVQSEFDFGTEGEQDANKDNRNDTRASRASDESSRSKTPQGDKKKSAKKPTTSDKDRMARDSSKTKSLDDAKSKSDDSLTGLSPQQKRRQAAIEAQQAQAKVKDTTPKGLVGKSKPRVTVKTKEKKTTTKTSEPLLLSLAERKEVILNFNGATDNTPLMKLRRDAADTLDIATEAPTIKDNKDPSDAIEELYESNETSKGKLLKQYADEFFTAVDLETKKKEGLKAGRISHLYADPTNDYDKNRIRELLESKQPKETNKKPNRLYDIQQFLRKLPDPVDQLNVAAFLLVEVKTKHQKLFGTLSMQAYEGNDGNQIASFVEAWVSKNLSQDTVDWFNSRLSFHFSSGQNIDTQTETRKTQEADQQANLDAQEESDQKEALEKGISVAELQEQKLAKTVQSMSGKEAAPGVEVDPINIQEDYPIVFETDLGDLGVESGIGFDIDYEGYDLPVDAVTHLDRPMHPSVAMALYGGNLRNALLALKSTSNSKRVSQLANKLLRYVGTTKVEIVDTMDGAGSFDPTTNTIRLNAKEGVNVHTLLHEMVHAAVSAELDNPSSQVRNQINKLFNSVKDLVDTAYGSTNIQEFVAEAMSNPEFGQQLASININGEPISAYRRFVNIIKNFSRRLVGLPSLPMDNMPPVDALTKVSNLFDGLAAPAPKYRNADILKLNTSKADVYNVLRKSIGGTQKQINNIVVNREQYVSNVVQFLLNTSALVRRTLIKLTNSQALGDIGKKLGFGDLLSNLHIMLENQRGDMMEADTAMKAVETKFAAWRNNEKNEKKKEAFDNLIYSRVHGATIYQVDPDLTRAQAEKRYGEQKNKDGRRMIDIWELQRKDWNSLGKDGQDMYRFIRDTYKKNYIKLQNVISRRLDKLAEDGELDKDNAEELKQTVFNQIFKVNTLDVYFPLSRKGDFKLVYAYKNPKSPEQSLVVEMFTTDGERNKTIAELEAINAEDKANNREETYDLDNMEIVDKDLIPKNFRNAPSMSFVKNTLDILQRGAAVKDADGNFELDANGKKKFKAVDSDIQKDIVQLFINHLPETSLAKALQGRRNVEGHLTDSMFAFKDKAYDLARQTVRIDYDQRIRYLEKQIDELTEDQAKKAIEGKSLAARITKAISPTFKDMKQEALNRAEFGRNPPSEPIIKKLNQAAFIYTIGFNVSSALVNLTQVPMFVYPYLAARYGTKDSFGALQRSYRLVTRTGNNLLSKYDVSEEGIYTLKTDPSMLNKDGTLNDAGKELSELTPLVQNAANRGLLNISFLQDVLGLDESGKKKSLGDKISAGSAFFFNHAERYNRQTTLATSYTLEMKRLNGKLKGNLPTKAETEMTLPEKQQLAAERAIYQTQETNGGAVLETAPSLTQRGWGRVAFMYKSYGLQMYYTMFKSLKTALDSDFSKAERKIAVKQLVGIHGSAIFFAGIHGIPIYGLVSMMYNLLNDDEEEDFDKMVRDYVGEGWYKGALATATGIDMSNRARLTGLLLQENKFSRSDAGLAEEFIGFHLGGPALSTVNRLLRSGRDFADGEFERGFESFLPQGITNVVKASPWGRLSKEGGYKTRRKDPIYTDIAFHEQLGQFIGFAPTNYTRAQEINNSRKGIDIAINKERSKLMKKYYLAKRMGDYGEVQNVVEKIEKFNDRHSASSSAQITRDSIDKSMRRHAQTSLEMYNGVTLTPIMQELLRESGVNLNADMNLTD